MDGFEGVDVYTPLVLVDRTGLGGCEIIYDGVRILFKKDQPKRAVPKFVVDWLFIHGKHMVWTTDGQFTNRFGIEDPSEELLATLGPDIGDCSPIEIDGNRAEGWDTTAVERDERTMRLVPVSVPAQSMRERQGGGGGSTSGFAASEIRPGK